MEKLKILLLAAFIVITILLIRRDPFSNPQVSTNEQTLQTPPPTLQESALTQKPAIPVAVLLSEPLSNSLSRVTKKPFGFYVTPKNSPVSPERFQGYHTGADFETTADEQNVDIPVYTVCTGPLLMKKWASGYGGVAVQQCEIDKQAVTVIYGHLKLDSIKPADGFTMQVGQSFAVLGNGFSNEIDGERKHLHLGIHKGIDINILGYVQKQAQLDQWLDPLKYF